MKKSINFNNPTFKKIAVFFSLFFSLFACMSAALAWFCNNRLVKGGDLSMEPKDYDLHCEYEVFRFDSEDGKGINRDSEGNPFNILDGSFTFRPYDSIFSTLNVRNPVLVRITVTGTKFQEVTSGTLSITLARDLSKDITEIKKDREQNDVVMYAPYFTSAMRFKFAAGKLNDAINYTSTDPDTIMDSAYDFFTTNDSSNTDAKTGQVFPYSYADENDSSITVLDKYNEITLNAPFTSSDFVDVTINTVEKSAIIAYLYIDYDVTLAEQFSQTSLDGGNISEKIATGSSTDLANDLDTLEVGYITNN